MSEVAVRVEDDGAVRSVVLCRPERRNAITPALRDQLGAALDDATADDTVKVVLLRADGPDFCVGFDLEWAISARVGEPVAGKAWDSIADLAVIRTYAALARRMALLPLTQLKRLALNRSASERRCGSGTVPSATTANGPGEKRGEIGMRIRPALGSVALIVVAVASFSVLPVAADASSEVIALHVLGMANSEPTAAGHVAYTVDVFSVTTGERLGSLHDEISCSTTAPPPCLVFDVVTTVRLVDGEIANHAQWSGVPDPQRPGFLLVGTRPGAKTAEGMTGVYAGRAARWAGSGTVDVRRFPAQFGYDIFSIVTLDST